MFFDVAFCKAEQARGIDHSYFYRFFFRKKRKIKDLVLLVDYSENDRPVNLTNLFADFIREREMLYGARPATIRFYRKGWTAFERGGLPTTHETIKAAIVGMRESGLGIGGANNIYKSL